MLKTLPNQPLNIVVTDAGREVITLRALLWNLSQATHGLLHETNNAQYGSTKVWLEAYQAAGAAEAYLYGESPE